MSDDERLAVLLEQVTRQQHSGERPDLEALGREHPDLIAELRQLLNIAQLAELLRKPQDKTLRAWENARNNCCAAAFCFSCASALD